MCLAIYIGSDKELPCSKWDAKNPAFFVEDIMDSNHDGVEIQFDKKFIYYAGSYQGCGCGFYYQDYDVGYEQDPEEIEKSKADVEKLIQYLEDALADNTIQLFACWEGMQKNKPDFKGTIKPRDLMNSEFLIDSYNVPELYIIQNL